MNTYIGTKIINAKPMNRLEYNEFRNWQLPADENGADEGYLVEYLDGGKPNTPEYAGYVSWSPKDVFEKSYVLIGDVVELQPHQQRVVAEKAELDERIEKLNSYFEQPHFRSLHTDEQARMLHQAVLMEYYSKVLGDRIEAFQ